MTHANYRTLFELGFGSFPWFSVARPLIFIAIGLLIIKFAKRRPAYLVMGVFAACFAFVILLVSLINYVPEFFKLRGAYLSGKTSVVEGTVKDFRPAPKIGRARESFSVGGVTFSYNALDITPCFHDAPYHRGPIQDGLHVRIYYNAGCIQRLDVLQREGSVAR